jgi:sulfatase domain protein
MTKFFNTLIKSPFINIFVVTTVVMFVANVYKIYFFEGTDRIALMHMARSFTTIFLLNLVITHLIYLITRRLFKGVYLFYALIIFVLCFINFFTLTSLKTDINIAIIDSVVHTNPNEAIEFFQTFFEVKYLIIAILLTIIFYVMLRYKKANFKDLGRKTIVILSVIYLAFVAIFFTTSVMKLKSNKADKTISKLSEHILINYVFIAQKYLLDDNFLISNKKILEDYDESKKANQNIKTERQVANIVFIIGESLQRNEMSVYGFGLPTTPNLMALKQSANAIIYTDTTAPDTYTNGSLSKVLNFSNYESKEPWSKSLNIVDMFSLSGYKTSWISNQEGVSANILSPHASVAKRCDTIFFSDKFAVDWNYAGKSTDEVLLPIILKEKQNANGLKFYTIHLIGNHFKYKFRYPKEFNKFSENDLKANLNDKQKQIVAQYLNSVLYNDHIINEIYKFFKDDETLIVYLSDHGETLFKKDNVLEHGITNRFVLEIPLIFIGTDKFKAKYPEIWQKLESAKDYKFMSDDIIHTFADIIGVKPLEYNASRSLISGEFNASRKRLVNGTDYENIKNVKPQW